MIARTAYRWLLTLCLFVGFNAAAQSLEEVNVSIGGHNSFTFKEQVREVVLTGNAPIKAKDRRPTVIAGNHSVLIEIDQRTFYSQSWNQQPLVMVVSLESGEVRTFKLYPAPDHEVALWKDNGFDKGNAYRTPIQRPEDAWLQESFMAAVQGKIPPGFSVVQTPSAGVMGELEAKYIAAFKNDAYVLLVASLHSSKLAWITPQDLYVPGVKAVLIDGDRVGVKDAPVAYVLIAGER